MTNGNGTQTKFAMYAAALVAMVSARKAFDALRQTRSALAMVGASNVLADVDAAVATARAAFDAAVAAARPLRLEAKFEGRGSLPALEASVLLDADMRGALAHGEDVTL